LTVLLNALFEVASGEKSSNKLKVANVLQMVLLNALFEASPHPLYPNKKTQPMPEVKAQARQLARLMSRAFYAQTHGKKMLDPIQESFLLKERVILVNAKDEEIGSATKFDAHQWSQIMQNRCLHRAFSVFLFNSKKEMLLQQRAAAKVTFPEYWTNACCSHPLYDKDEEKDPQVGTKRAAQRKLQHELGISVPLDSFHLMNRIIYKAQSPNGTWGEHELDHVLIVTGCDLAPNFNPNEVQAAKFVSAAEMKKIRAADSDSDRRTGDRRTRLTPSPDPDRPGTRLTPWLKLILDQFLFDWWSGLENLPPPDEKIYEFD